MACHGLSWLVKGSQSICHVPYPCSHLHVCDHQDKGCFHQTYEASMTRLYRYASSLLHASTALYRA